MAPDKPSSRKSGTRGTGGLSRPNPRDATLPWIASALIARDRLIPRGATVLIAVSGGADSMALLQFLATEWGRPGARREPGRAGGPREPGRPARDAAPARFAVAHVNHGLRGEEAELDARLVRERAAALGLPWFEATIPPGALRPKGDAAPNARGAGNAPRGAALPSEEAARRLRYGALCALATEAGADRVATAHTADDQAETIILRLARGAGLRGLAGMPSRGRVHGARVIRPLLDVTREQVLGYLARHEVPYREDASNASLAAARNAVRHDILPRLRERLNPSIREALLREAALFREADEYLEAEGRLRLAECRMGGAEGKIVLDRARLLSYPKLLRSYVFRSAVQELNGALREFGRTHFDALLSLVTQSSGRSADLPLGLSAWREGDRIVLARRDREPGPGDGSSNSGDIGPSCRSMKGNSTE